MRLYFTETPIFAVWWHEIGVFRTIIYMAAWPHADLQSTVTEVCVGCPSLLRPSAYFVAWNGVLALVYVPLTALFGFRLRKATPAPS